MTGMEQAIEQAKTVIDVILRSDPQIAHGMRGDEPEMVARALASVGLLAPSITHNPYEYEEDNDA